MSRQIAVVSSMTLLVVGAFILSTAQRPIPAESIDHRVETRFGPNLFEKPADFVPTRMIPDDIFELERSVEYVEVAPGDVERREKWVRRKSSGAIEIETAFQPGRILLPRRHRDFSLDTATQMIKKSSPYYLLMAP